MELDYGFMIETFYKIWDGIGVTLGLTALSLLIALPISFYMAVIRLRGNKLGTGITRFYISFVRGTPLVLQILLMYSLLPSFLNFALKSMGSSFNIFESVNPSGMPSSSFPSIPSPYWPKYSVRPDEYR